MKKILAAICLLSAFAVQADAQSLFETVYKNAVAVVNDPKANDEQIHINQFKVTALNYIRNQVEKRKQTKDSYFYDSQAVNMTSFVTDFETNLIKARSISTAKRLAVINCYREATLKNPLFNDSDKSTSMVYVNDKATLTPFCLDCDWNKAYEMATQQVKDILR